MPNRLLTIAIGLALVAATFGKLLLTYVPTSTDTGSLLLSWGLGLGELAGLLLLVQNSTIWGTAYATSMLLLYGAALAGALLNILHWFGANRLLPASLAGIALTYIVRFLRKGSKGQLDVLKLLWVLAACSSFALVSLRLVPREATYVAHGLLWLTVLDFLYLESKKRAVSRE